MWWRGRKKTVKRTCAEMNVTNATQSLDNLVFWMKCNPMTVFQVLSGIVSLYLQAKATKKTSKNNKNISTGQHNIIKLVNEFIALSEQQNKNQTNRLESLKNQSEYIKGNQHAIIQVLTFPYLFAAHGASVNDSSSSTPPPSTPVSSPQSSLLLK